MNDFEILSHTADLKIRVYGKNEKELFKNSLIGMFQSMKPISDKCRKENNRVICSNFDKKRYIEAESSELELLLVDFLSEALYLSDVNNEAYLDVDISYLSQIKINAVLKGIAISGFEESEIKAVTYNDLKIIHIDRVLCADIVFDI